MSLWLISCMWEAKLSCSESWLWGWSPRRAGQIYSSALVAVQQWNRFSYLGKPFTTKWLEKSTHIRGVVPVILNLHEIYLEEIRHKPRECFIYEIKAQNSIRKMVKKKNPAVQLITKLMILECTKKDNYWLGSSAKVGKPS